MPSTLPDGEPAPRDGALPAAAREAVGRAPFGVYVHVPFCSSRCGYCDFNTYTPGELGGAASPQSYLDAALAEVGLARRVLGDAELPVQTVFFGGGTPTLLAPEQLGALLHAVDDAFGLAAGAEVTVEANPESVDEPYLAALRAAGATRLSLGMQSAVPHVLAVLDRRHTPGAAVRRVADARAAGFEQVSLDLIYGAPGESDADWQASLDAALSAAPDHVSAYSLIVEDGTRLAARVRRGELPMPDDDVLAGRYEMADTALSAAGLPWYEVSNWGAPCRHNLGYWRSHDWWGVGPGAHSHLAGARWWNVKHPAAYAARLAAGDSPAAGREVLDAETRRVERVLLGLRLKEGLPVHELTDTAQRAAGTAVAGGLVRAAGDRLVLTDRGRLLADAVARDLLA